MCFFETLLHLGKESKLSMHSIFTALIRKSNEFVNLLIRKFVNH